MKTMLIVVTAVVAAAVLGFVLQRRLGVTSPPTTPSVASAPAQAPEGSGADAAAPVLPDTLAGFQFTDADGKLRSLSEWSGRPLIVNFWATWCAPCRREIPLLNELRASPRIPELEVIGLALDFREDVLAYAKETRIDYPVLVGEDAMTVMTAFGMPQTGLPFTFFADSKQRIVGVRIGELHRDEAEWVLDRLGRVDAGTLALAEARVEIEAGLKEFAAARAVAAAEEAAEAG